MTDLLIVVDMQRDFVSGALGSEQARKVLGVSLTAPALAFYNGRVSSNSQGFDGSQWVSVIRGWGRELGFSQIAVAGIDLGSAEPGLSAWLVAGFHGDMHYMAAHGLKRARPTELVPGTLRAGWEEGQAVDGPFRQAGYLMFLVSEVHPFVDGNGRSVRFLSAAAAVQGGCSPVYIPAESRKEYIASLERGESAFIDFFRQCPTTEVAGL